ncbi:ECF transporter S component [Orenia metallireducens]|uniref:ECF transporter S component n=1 Tax=Orenia metallireducens TaxID=1413210 RepID=A0A1C0A7B7_9FIRM|nr:ECF transporter S component [Orenia metallireducens]OCL26143.1 ECF transporter S component [Orenia metallireducens]
MKIDSRNEKLINLVRVSLLIALSAVGAYLKFPSPIGSIALDSLPGYLGVLLLGGAKGSIILIIGHLISALTASLPLGPIHLIIALLMGVSSLIFGYLIDKNRVLATVIAIIYNGIIIPALLIPILGLGFFIGIVPMLLLASGVNIGLALLLSRFFKEEQF